MLLESLAPKGFEDPKQPLWELLSDADGDSTFVPRPDSLPPGPNGLTNSMVASVCIHILAETVAQLPIQILKREGDRRSPQLDHPIRRLLNGKPNPEMDAFTFRESLSGHCLGWGAGYAEIEYSNGGEPLHLWPIPPWRCLPVKLDGKLWYFVNTDEGYRRLAPSQIFQVLWWSPNGYRGYSPVRLAARDLKLSEKLETFALKYFDEGYHISGFITSPKSMSPEAIKKLRFQIEDMHKGLDRSHRVGLLDEGMSWEGARLPLEEAQLLQSRVFSWQQVAALYRITPDRVNILEKTSFASLDATEIRFVKDAIVPLCRRWESPVDDRLLNRWELNEEEIFCRHNVDAVLRGDPKIAAEVFAIERQNGVISADDWRAKKDMNPLGGKVGKTYLWPLNFAPAGEDFQIKQPPANKSAGALRAALEQSTLRILGRESKAKTLSEWYETEATCRFLLQEFGNVYEIALLVADRPNCKDDFAALAVDSWKASRLSGQETEDFIENRLEAFKEVLFPKEIQK